MDKSNALGIKLRRINVQIRRIIHVNYYKENNCTKNVKNIKKKY